MPPSPAIGDRIRSLRGRVGLSVSELARLAEVSKGYISQLEHGDARHPSYDVVSRLASALGVSYSDLLGETEVPSRPLPPSLVAFASEANLAPEETEMLAGIHLRGRQPEAPEDWAHLYETIKRTVR